MSEVAEATRSGGGGNRDQTSRSNGSNSKHSNGSMSNNPQSEFNNQAHAAAAAVAASNAASAAGHQQEFNWKTQQQMEAYSNFYYPPHHHAPGYSPFSGDMRDSIAAIWSRTSPASGEGFAAASGGYAGQGSEGFAAAAAAAAGHPHQFAANLNFAPTSELSMFGQAAADYSAYGQYHGFGTTQYTQWPDNNATTTNNSTNQQRNYSYAARNNQELMDVQQGLESIKLTSANMGNSRKDSKSGGGGGGSKMSWASVASQPAKPQVQAKTVKKPGVLPPPTIIPSTGATKAPPAPQQTPSEKLIVQQAPVHHQSLMEPSNMQPNPVVAAATMMMQPPPPPPAHVTVPPPSVLNNHHHQPQDGSGFRPPSSSSHPPPPVKNHHHPSGPPRRPAQGQHGSHQMPQSNGNNNVAMPSNSKSMHPVLESLRSFNEYNPKSFDLSPKDARFFVIKSFSEDDIHRSIKYEIWCSTDHGNKRLDAAFKAQNGRGPIYLFFSVNASGHFCGMAEMLSSLDYTDTGNCVWVQDKFKGQFKVKWIYVKDVPNIQLRHIRLENNEDKPVTNSRDTQEVPYEKGKMVLKILHNFKHTTSLFDDFVHYEKKQEEENIKKKHEVHHEHHDGRERPHGHQDRGHHHPRSHRGGGERGDHHQDQAHHSSRNGRGERGERGDRDGHHHPRPRRGGHGGQNGPHKKPMNN
jgi:hypothetical protein